MKPLLRPLLLAAVAASAFGMAASVFAQSGKSTQSPKVDKAKASYVVGWQLAGALPPIVRENVDPAVVAKAVQAALSGKKMNMSKADAEAVQKAFIAELRTKAKAKYEEVAAANKKQGDAFLAKNRHAHGVHTTASGLEYQVIKKGDGARPGPSDTVQVKYVGTFLNGRKFDASADHPEPKGGDSMPIPLANVIPGFREGLQLMQVGGHYKFWIPSNLAYGAQPKQFPPNETLVFDVTLESIKPAPPATSNAANGK